MHLSELSMSPEVSKEESLSELVKILQNILRREDTENEDAIVSFNTRKFQNTLKDFFKAHNLQEDEVEFKSESIQAAIDLLSTSIRKTLRNIPENEVSRISALVDYLLDLRMPKNKTKEKIEVWKDFENYLRNGESIHKYPPELSAQLMPAYINEREFRKVLKTIKPDKLTKVIWTFISNINTQNIHELEYVHLDLIMTKLKHTPEELELVKAELRKLITLENVKLQDKHILDMINHGGRRGDFIRTFFPDHQGFWSKLLFYRNHGVKSIG